MKKKTSKLLLILLAFVMIFTACNNNQTAEETKEETVEETAVSEEKPEEKEPEVEKEEEKEPEEIDEESGLIKEGELELKYAESFAIDFLEDGIMKYTDVEGRVVYLLPEGTSMENDELLTLDIPVERIAIFSTVDATILRPIDKLDTIVATTSKAETWRIPEIKEKVESDEITYLGSKSALDYEKLEEVDPEVIFFTYENLDRTPKLILLKNSV